MFGVGRDGTPTGWNPEHLLQVGHGPPPARAGRLPGRRPRPAASPRSHGRAGRWRRCASAHGEGRRSCSRRTAPTSTGPAGSTHRFGAGWCSSATVRRSGPAAHDGPRALRQARGAAHPARHPRAPPAGGEGADRLRGDRRAPAVGADRLGRAVPSRRRPPGTGARPHRLRRHPPLPAEGARRRAQPARRAADRDRLRDPVRAPGAPHRRSRRVLPPTEVRIAAVQRVLRDVAARRSTSATRSSSRRPRPPTAAAPSPPAERHRSGRLLGDGLDPGEGLVDALLELLLAVADQVPLGELDEQPGRRSSRTDSARLVPSPLAVIS